VLPGITYDVVLELAAANGIPVEVREISEQESGAPTNSGCLLDQGSARITSLDGKPVGNGKPGRCSQNHRLYQDFKRTVMRQAA